MTCPRCGMSNLPGSEFCDCGYRLAQMNSPSVGPVSLALEAGDNEVTLRWLNPSSVANLFVALMLVYVVIMIPFQLIAMVTSKEAGAIGFFSMLFGLLISYPAGYIYPLLYNWLVRNFPSVAIRGEVSIASLSKKPE